MCCLAMPLLPPEQDFCLCTGVFAAIARIACACVLAGVLPCMRTLQQPDEKTLHSHLCFCAVCCGNEYSCTMSASAILTHIDIAETYW